MKRFIFDARNGIYIIDLIKTLAQLETACKFLSQVVAQGGHVLFVGTIEPRKNLTRLLATFQTLHADGLADGLVIAGRRGWLYDSFFAALERSPAQDAVILPGYVPDADLPAVYAGARVLVLPSLYEGFGLPVLEAMACGTPVACSGTSSLPEVTGDAAFHFDPKHIESITVTLRRLLGDADLRAVLQQRGLQQAADFSWELAAARTETVYATATRAQT